jgi:hypothetical protein
MTGVRRFRLLQASVAVASLLILLVIFFDRVSFYAVKAEEAAVEQVLAQLRAAIELQRIRFPSDSVLVGSNPMSLLAVTPPNYAGEITSLASTEIPVGNWMFNTETRELVYVLRGSDTSSNTQHKMLYFKLEFRRLPEHSARPAGTPHSNQGVVLNQIHHAATTPTAN